MATDEVGSSAPHVDHLDSQILAILRPYIRKCAHERDFLRIPTPEATSRLDHKLHLFPR